MNSTLRKARAVLGTCLLALPLMTTACYHATVETGLAPSGQSIEKPWASSFLFGVVPPAAVATAAECPAGVARVETQQSFVNGLVAGITFGLYTPMTISVQCAAPGARTAANLGDDTHVELQAGATRAELQDALQRAADAAAEVGAPVYVSFSEIR